MTLKHILSTGILAFGLTLTGTARADFVSERIHLERELDHICTTSIGAEYNSTAYLDCRDFYDRKFYDYGLDWDYLTPAEVNAFLKRTRPYITHCRNQGLVSTLLWGCIRDFEDRYYRDWHHHHPNFKPKHEYRSHFGDRPHGDIRPAPDHRPDVRKGPEPRKAPEMRKEPEPKKAPEMRKEPNRESEARHRPQGKNPYTEQRKQLREDMKHPETQGMNRPDTRQSAPQGMDRPDNRSNDHRPDEKSDRKH